MLKAKLSCFVFSFFKKNYFDMKKLKNFFLKISQQLKTKKSSVQPSVSPSPSTITTQNVRAGAAAFFGAMSQEWFR